MLTDKSYYGLEIYNDNLREAAISSISKIKPKTIILLYQMILPMYPHNHLPSS